MAEYTLPDLDWDYAALEPHISGQINEIHHTKHHATYVKGVNDALAKLEEARANEDHAAIFLNERTSPSTWAATSTTRSGGRTCRRTAVTSPPVSWPPRSTTRSGPSTSSGRNSAPPPTACRAPAGRCWAMTPWAAGC